MTYAVFFGDELEITFSLKYNVAAVARRPDKSAYEVVSLRLYCVEKKKEALEPSFSTPGKYVVTKDDEAVKFSLVLHDASNPKLFERDEVWVVAAQYQGKDGTLPDPNYYTPLFDMKFS